MFSQDPTSILQKEEKKGFSLWYKKFSSQPHQPFFTNGILFFMLFLLLLVLSFTNIVNLNRQILDYHAFTMIFVVFIQFFLGFLFVVFPRFLMQAEIEPKLYMRIFILFFISSIGIFISLLFSINVLFKIIEYASELSNQLCKDIWSIRSRRFPNYPLFD